MQSERCLARPVHAAVLPFVISGDLDHILDYVQIKSHNENLNPQNGDDGQREPQPEHMAPQSKPLSMNRQYNLEEKTTTIKGFGLYRC